MKLGKPSDFPGLSRWPDSSPSGYYSFAKTLSAMVPWETVWSAGIWVDADALPDPYSYFLSTGAFSQSDGLNVYLTPSSGDAVLTVDAGGGIETGTYNMLGKGPMYVHVHRRGGFVGFNMHVRLFDRYGNHIETLERQVGGSGSQFDMQPLINIGRRGDANADRYHRGGAGHFYLMTWQSRYGGDTDLVEAKDLDIARDAANGVDMIDKYGDRMVCYLPLTGTLKDLTGNGYDAVFNPVSKPGMYQDSSIILPPTAANDYEDVFLYAPYSAGGTNYSKTLSSSITASDYEARTLDAVRKFADSVDLEDLVQATLAGIFTAVLRSSVDVSDAGSILLRLVREVLSQAAIESDTVLRSIIGARSTSDAVDAYSDALTSAIRNRLGYSETDTSDSVTHTALLDRLGSDDIETSDILASVGQFVRTLFSNYDTSDDVIASIVGDGILYYRTLTEDLGISDEVAAEIVRQLVGKIIMDILPLYVVSGVENGLDVEMGAVMEQIDFNAEDV